MAVIKPTDISANGSARLLPQFSKSTKLQGLLESLLGGAQPTEDTLFEVMSKTGIDTATGVQLDLIGKLLGLRRSDKTDEVYRTSLYAQIALNSAKGSPESIINLTKIVTGSEQVTLSEVYPAEVHVNVVGGLDPQDNFLDLVSPAGVGSYLSKVPEGSIYWLVSEEGEEQSAGVLPEEGDEAGHAIAEEIN